MPNKKIFNESVCLLERHPPSKPPSERPPKQSSIMTPYIIFLLYSVGIISTLARIFVWKFIQEPPGVIHNDPYRRQTHRNRVQMEVLVGSTLVVWTISICFAISGLQGLLPLNTIFPTIWVSSITTVWLAKIYQLLHLQQIISWAAVLEFSLLFVVQTYIASLLAFGMSVCDYFVKSTLN